MLPCELVITRKSLSILLILQDTSKERFGKLWQSYQINEIEKITCKKNMQDMVNLNLRISDGSSQIVSFIVNEKKKEFLQILSQACLALA